MFCLKRLHVHPPTAFLQHLPALTGGYGSGTFTAPVTASATLKNTSAANGRQKWCAALCKVCCLMLHEGMCLMCSSSLSLFQKQNKYAAGNTVINLTALVEERELMSCWAECLQPHKQQEENLSQANELNSSLTNIVATQLVNEFLRYLDNDRWIDNFYYTQ